MESGEPNQLGILGLAAVLFLAALPALWKAAGLRGDTNKKWSERVEVAHAGLSERATSELLQLQNEIGTALGGATGFTPAQVWIDPDPLVKRANKCADLLRVRDKLHDRFRRHRRLGPILITPLIAYAIGVVAGTLYFTEVAHNLWMRNAAFLLDGLALAALVVIFAFYVYYEAQLTKAEELAKGPGA